MAEATQYVFTHKELVELLIRKQGLHEGIWSLAFQLALAGGNVAPPSGTGIVPAAIIPILSVGLQKTDKESEIAVDAAKINPTSKK